MTASRAGAAAILLLLLGLFWAGPVEAYFGQLASGSAATERRAALAQRYRALTAPGVAERAAPAEAALLLPDIPDAQAAALLQETVKAAAGTAQIQIRGMQVLRAQAASGAVRIGIRINAAGGIAEIGRLLYAVEAARPALYPDNLQIRAGAAAPAPLEFQLDVLGFKAGAS